MNKTLLAAIFLCLTAATSSANTVKQEYNSYSNDIKVGIGTAYFERIHFPNSTKLDYRDRPSTVTYMEKQRHSYVPHIFVEYFHSFKPWYSLGAQVDFSGFSWENQYFKGGSNEIIKKEKQNCYNILLQAYSRFNWLRKKYITLYSGIGVGVAINTGTEIDPYGNKTLAGIAVTPVLIGISAGYGHWFGSVELSGLNALKNPHQIFLVGARGISVSAGFRF